MSRIINKLIIVFFSILIAIMAGAYIIDKMTTPSPAPLKPVPKSESEGYVKESTVMKSLAKTKSSTLSC